MLCLSLALTDIKRCGCAWLLVWNLDLSISTLIAHDVLLQSLKQALGMFGSQNHATLYLCLGHTGKNTSIVDNEVAARVSDYCEVCILSLCYVLWQLNLELAVVVLIVFHFFFLS